MDQNHRFIMHSTVPNAVYVEVDEWKSKSGMSGILYRGTAVAHVKGLGETKGPQSSDYSLAKTKNVNITWWDIPSPIGQNVIVLWTA